MGNTPLTNAKVMCFVATAKPDEARTFYSEVLGLTFLWADKYGMAFAVDTTRVLRVQNVPDLNPQPFTAFGWDVDNIDDTVGALSDRGVQFEIYGFPGQDSRGICTFENGDKVAWFKDPDGNTLSIARISGS